MFLKLMNHFIENLPGIDNPSKVRRQTFESCYALALPTKTAKPTIVSKDTRVAELLKIDKNFFNSSDFPQYMTGNKAMDDAKPYAMCYGGHQFGQWAGQLGDGRAINLGERKVDSRLYTLQLKGSGETPYSRGADGRAVLRSSIREYLCSQAMHYLGIPTTDVLSLCLTGDQVMRDMMYDGNSAYEQGAIVCRVAPSFIRFGSFEILAARKEHETLRKLTDYTIKHHFAHIKEGDYSGFFEDVVTRTLDLIVHWQRVGFVHGVMNTDNMSILGLTIDYGPYGWIDNFDQHWTPNTTDSSTKRYRYGYQPSIALWNLVRLAHALFPLISDVKKLEDILGDFQRRYKTAYYTMMEKKLGLASSIDRDDFIDSLLTLLQDSGLDMTIFFRELIEWENMDQVEGLLAKASYTSLSENDYKLWHDWFEAYAQKINDGDLDDRLSIMLANNPRYVLRNYMSQMAIDAAEKGDFTIFKELEALIKNPYTDQKDMDKWYAKRPDWAKDKVGCSMLSCSS